MHTFGTNSLAALCSWLELAYVLLDENNLTDMQICGPSVVLLQHTACLFLAKTACNIERGMQRTEWAELI